MKKTEQYNLDHIFLNFPTTTGSWMNFGNWKGLDSSSQYTIACENAAKALGEAVGLQPRSTIMDVGFGCGDQDFYFLKEFQVAKIIGYSNSRSQVELARKRCEELEEKRFEPCVGVAPHLPPCAIEFDAVLSLDSAYHYDTREEFFRTAFRSLKTGGKLGLVDIAVNEPLTLLQRVALLPLSKMIGIPRKNLYSSREYCQKMENAGFGGVSAEVLDECAFTHLPVFIESQIERFRPILNPGLINKYTIIAAGMRLLCRLRIFQLTVFVGTKEAGS